MEALSHRTSSALVVTVLASLAWAAACGDGATEPPPLDPPRATTLTVTPATAELKALEETAQLSAEVRDQNGNAMAGAAVTWASSAPAVAAVNASGLVTAAGNGTATITASAGSASGTSVVTVKQEVSTVTVSPAADTLVVGDTLRLSAVAADANGHPVADAEFSWASSDTLVAVVDEAGLVTGIGAGQAELAATSAGVTGRAELTFEAPTPTTVAVTPDTVSLTARGQTIQLAAEVRDQAGRVVEDIQVSWSSADTTVVAVDSAGLVTAVGNGTATVTAGAGGASGTSTATVMQVVSGVTVTPAADTLTVGDTLRLEAEAFDANEHAISGAEFFWESNDLSIAVVDDSGLVQAMAEGRVTVTATSSGVVGRAELLVGALPAPAERGVLETLYRATGGNRWVNNENWLTGSPLSDWYGVSVNHRGAVIGLHLESNNLAGPIPSALADLTNLERLHLGDNELTGPIPPELGALGHLTRLDLSRNSFWGPIPPELGLLARLSTLDLSLNSLDGPVPTELGSLPAIRELDLGFNRLTGPIPPELASLNHLEDVSLVLNGLTGPIPPDLGSLASLKYLALSGNRLTGPVPPELGSLANLRTLEIADNELTGELPRELGNVTGLRLLSVDANRFTGHLPREFLELLRMVRLHWGENDGLCAPGTTGFVGWLQGLTESEGPLCNADDVTALTALHSAAGGTNWTNAEGWQRIDAALEAWYGVTTDSLGRVLALDLSDNGLVGRVPGSLGRLALMTELRIGGNALSGPLPLQLAELPLDLFHYTDTELCTPAAVDFQVWLNGIASHEGTGAECGPLSDRDALVALYDAAGGAGWNNSRNWLTEAPLETWHGIELDEQHRVSRIDLGANNLVGSIPAELGALTSLRALLLSLNVLTGPIPSELGALTSLEWLSLHYNNLSGPIPAELGALANLTRLFLPYNQLTGPIPPELGALSNLEWLQADENQLTGRIPRGLGRLPRLRVLTLSGNELTGPIPSELGNLTKLEELTLHRNNLAGPIPRGLGGLRNLTRLRLSRNRLSGPLPVEFGGLTKLTQLTLFGNEGLSGALPGTLTNLSALEEFQAGDTGLCIPGDPGLQEWLGRIPLRRVAVCDNESMAYLTQAAQSRAFPVPLIAGKEALLRVFVTAMRPTGAEMPPVHATFHVDGAETYVTTIPGREVPIPTEIDESSLSKSANARIPAWVLQPGLEVVIDVDPDETLDPSLGVKKRIPETGRLAVDVTEVPTLDLTLIPFVRTGDRDASIIDIVADMAADHETLLWQMHALLPVRDLMVTPHAPVRTTSENGVVLLHETEAIRVMEGADGYYMGLLREVSTGLRGIANLPGKSSFSVAVPRTMVHELGHNLSLWHAPCGGAGGPDPAFPEADGSVGIWGYDFRGEGRLVNPTTPDFMSYCFPSWTSDFDFSKALGHRLRSEAEGNARVSTDAAAVRSLLLWGGVDADGAPFLEPAFVVKAPPALPAVGGAYQLQGTSGEGRTLFSLSFDMPEVADGDGRTGFAFTLPVQTEWAEALASITLTGPVGSTTLHRESDRAVAILRDPRSGQVRGILRDLPEESELRAAATAAMGDLARAVARLDIRVSRGIPTAAEWHR